MKNITVVCVETRPEMWSQVIMVLKTCQTSLKIETQPVLVVDDPEVSALKDAATLGFDVRSCSPISNTTDYSKVVITESSNWFDTDFVLFVQQDGFVINPTAWTDSFLEYDYIGAPWPVDPFGRYVQHPIITDDNCVGNGGFSLRSKKLCDLASARYKELLATKINPWFFYPEDSYICRNQREYFESKGIKFAPKYLAHKFSIENDVYSGQLGFHGKETIEINKKLGIFK